MAFVAVLVVAVAAVAVKRRVTEHHRLNRVVAMLPERSNVYIYNNRAFAAPPETASEIRAHYLREADLHSDCEFD